MSEKEKREKELEEDLVFVDEESVKDKSKMAEDKSPLDKTIQRKKTRRRTSDSMEIQKDRSIAFLRRYIVVIGILVLLAAVALGAIVVAVKKHKASKGAPNEQTLTDTSFEIDAHDDVNKLIEDYFAAYTDGDVDKLITIAYPMSDAEKEYITLFSGYVDGFEDITCYTKPGADAQSYITAVYANVKYKEIKTKAPSLYYFYVQKDDSGNLYINNLYSEYNQVYKELEQDAEIASLLGTCREEADTLELEESIHKNYTQALEKDQELKKMLEETIPGEIAKLDQQAQAQEQEAQQKAEEEKKKEEQKKQEEEKKKEEQKKKEEKAVKENVYATDNINIRKSPSTDAATVGSALTGAEMTRIAVRGDGWSKVQTGNIVGYVKSEFISKDKPKTQASSSKLTPGKKIYLLDTVNVRASMSENSERIGVAYSGETVTVVENYAQGWTKVNWKGQVGYVKTDILAAAA